MVKRSVINCGLRPDMDGVLFVCFLISTKSLLFIIITVIIYLFIHLST